MIRIALISLNDHVPWGGSEVLWSELALRLIRRDDLDIGISPKKWDSTPEPVLKLLEFGAKDYRRQDKRLPILLHRIITKLAPEGFLSTPGFGTYDILTKFKPDLVIISLGNHNLGHEWARLCRRFNIPYVVIVQLVKDATYPPPNTQYYSDLRESYIKARMVLCASYDNIFLLQKQFAHDLGNAVVINNPIRHLETIPKYPRGRTATFALVASLNPNHKGHDILLEVLRSEKWRNRDLQVNFYGSGPFEKILKDLVQYWQLKNVSFHGYTNIVDIWASNQMLIMPTRMEGLSLAFLEALNCERPAIITNLGDAERFIEDDVNGYLLVAPHAKLLDEAMERAWNKKDQWEEMGRLARKRLWQEITEDPVTCVENLVLDLVDAPSG